MTDSSRAAFLIDGVGLWAEVNCAIGRYAGRAAVFLDRDGVIVEETDYLGRPDNVRMIPGAAAAIRELNKQRVPVIVVTNQAGIAYGHYGWDGFYAVQARITSELQLFGAHLDMVLACGYGERGTPPLVVGHHPWRKPNPGMLQHASSVLGIDLGSSLIIGDKGSDIEAGRRAGLGLGVLVYTGHGRAEVKNLGDVSSASYRILEAPDLAAALKESFDMSSRGGSLTPTCVSASNAGE